MARTGHGRAHSFLDTLHIYNFLGIGQPERDLVRNLCQPRLCGQGYGFSEDREPFLRYHCPSDSVFDGRCRRYLNRRFLGDGDAALRSYGISLIELRLYLSLDCSESYQRNACFSIVGPELARLDCYFTRNCVTDTYLFSKSRDTFLFLEVDWPRFARLDLARPLYSRLG